MRLTLFFGGLIALVIQSAAQALSLANTTSSNLTIAMVRAAPPNWPTPLLNYDWCAIELNISQTIDAGIGYIEAAAAQGADAITFPELWFPG